METNSLVFSKGLWSSFFLVFINDLPDNLVCNPNLFTDDVSLNVVMLDKNINTNYLKDDLNRCMSGLLNGRWSLILTL